MTKRTVKEHGQLPDICHTSIIVKEVGGQI